MKKETVSISQVLKSRRESANAVKESPDFEGEITNVKKKPAEKFKELNVDYSRYNVEAIEVPAINDEHGRISDAIEALELETGLSVIPFEMAHIAPEVLSLSRHSIFELGGKRYAMSHKLRMDELARYESSIIRTISSAIPFELVLNKKIAYNGEDYDTLLLSKDEWEYLLARFRMYKSEFGITPDNNIVLHVFAEKAV